MINELPNNLFNHIKILMVNLQIQNIGQYLMFLLSLQDLISEFYNFI